MGIFPEVYVVMYHSIHDHCNHCRLSNRLIFHSLSFCHSQVGIVKADPNGFTIRKMPFSNEDAFDMVVILGECRQAAHLYEQRYPLRHPSFVKTFCRVLQKHVPANGVPILLLLKQNTVED